MILRLLSVEFHYLETVKPSCEELGYERFQCSGCGELEKRNYTPAHGHNYDEIIDAIEKSKQCEDKPTAVICKTVKGKGVSFMENEAAWHGTAPSKEQCEKALAEIGGDR